jgi:hypothetical protein
LLSFLTMASNDFGRSVQEADERVERAKASLLARVELLRQKLVDAKGRVDLRAQIAAHPLPAIGVAFALGMLAGRQRTRIASAVGSTPIPHGRTLPGTALAGLAGMGLRLLRELAIGQLSIVARQWWIEHGGGTSEERASYQPDVEPFLEH